MPSETYYYHPSLVSLLDVLFFFIRSYLGRHLRAVYARHLEVCKDKPDLRKVHFKEGNALFSIDGCYDLEFLLVLLW